MQGDQKLEHIEGRADLLSVVLVGGQETYADVEFAVEALVTTCYPTQDYYVSPGIEVSVVGKRWLWLRRITKFNQSVWLKSECSLLIHVKKDNYYLNGDL